MNFNVRLKSIRKRYNVSMQSLAEALDISIRTYRRFEDGSYEPHLSTAISIANYFNLPVDCLLGNGLFANWEEVLTHKDEILSYLKDNIISLPDSFDLSTLTENQLANILPAVFTKITFDGSNMNLYSQIPAGNSPNTVHVDEP